MPKQKDSQQDQTPNPVNQEDGGAGNQQSGAPVNRGGNIGGVAGGQHKDWGHSPVDTKSTGLPRQGVMPGEEMGHLHRRKTDS